jgi:hypothetical protein
MFLKHYRCWCLEFIIYVTVRVFKCRGVSLNVFYYGLFFFRYSNEFAFEVCSNFLDVLCTFYHLHEMLIFEMKRKWSLYTLGPLYDSIPRKKGSIFLFVNI